MCSQAAESEWKPCPRGMPQGRLSDPREMALLLRLPGNGRNLAVEQEGHVSPGLEQQGPPFPVLGARFLQSYPHPTSELTSDTPGQWGELSPPPQETGEFSALLHRPWRQTAYLPVTWDSEKGPYQPQKTSTCLPSPAGLKAFYFPNSQDNPTSFRKTREEVQALEAHKLRRPES